MICMASIIRQKNVYFLSATRLETIFYTDFFPVSVLHGPVV